MKDVLYQNFKNRWEKVMILPTQTVGPLTPIYKRTVPFLKVAPWRILIPIAFIVVAVLFFLLEITAAQITTLLQRGF